MHRTADVLKTKSKVRVKLIKDDGTDLEGFFYASGQERVLDVMNQPTPFVPFELADGGFEILNKSAIVSIKPFDEDRMQNDVSSSGPTYMAPH